MRIALRLTCGILHLAAISTLIWAGSVRAATETAAKPAVAYGKYITGRVNSALDALQAGGDLDTAETALRGLFDQAVLYGPDDRFDALRQADFGRRLVEQIRKAPADKRTALLKFLRGNENLGSTLVFLIRPTDNVAGAYAMLDRLREKRAEQLEKYATLAAAICVVHERPLERHINENAVKSADPLEIFDYYVKNESKMFFGIRNVPAELLVYVVDTTASIGEMTWALDKYAGDKEVGKRFFDIKYDYDHFKKGTPKVVTQKGFNLQNILEYGGVCADQAYFACSVGKAIGVPTAYATGASGEVGHAWVGFLQSDGKQGWWNFNTGRYEAYKGVRGMVMDPQSRGRIPDSYVSLQAELIGTKPLDRQNAVALADAAARLVAMERTSSAPDVAKPGEDIISTSVRTAPRKADTAGELAVLEMALRQSPGYPPAWFGVRDLAVANKLSLADKRRWADLLLKLGAKKYPDFTLAVLTPMIGTIPDATQQDQLWQTVFELFQTRFDLAAAIRMQEAAMWEAQNDSAKAGLCYMDVIERFANAGPFVIDALRGAEKLLISSQRADKVVVLYEQTWARIKPPKEMAGQFMTQSNWYRVGKLYAKKLEEAGDSTKSKSVEGELSKRMGTVAAGV